MIYLDNHATTKLDPEVLDEMFPYFLEKYGNSSSRLHKYGWDAEEAVETARERVASIINAEPNEIIFTSGATESNNTIFKCLDVNNIIISLIEHNSIIKTCEYLKDKKIAKIKVNEDGIIDIDDFKSKLENVELISVMLANNEIGSIQPLMEIRKICPNIKIHSDIAQAVGKIQVDVKKLDIDYASFSAHKIYGPKGIGAIYVKGGVDNISSFMHGGGHEKGVRAGTHNVPAIVGFGKACEILENRFARDMYRIECMKMKMYSKLKDSVPEIKFHGDVLTSLPSCLNFSVPCGNPDVFITTLNQNVAVSFGSACLSLTNSLSHVLLAMGVPEEEIKRTVRVSIGRFNTMEEIELASDYIIEAINIAK